MVRRRERDLYAAMCDQRNRFFRKLMHGHILLLILPTRWRTTLIYIAMDSQQRHANVEMFRFFLRWFVGENETYMRPCVIKEIDFSKNCCMGTYCCLSCRLDVVHHSFKLQWIASNAMPIFSTMVRWRERDLYMAMCDQRNRFFRKLMHGHILLRILPTRCRTSLI